MTSRANMSSRPIPRPQREHIGQGDVRGSVLRASILESALELGVGTNRTVANWIFNPVDEGDEGAESESVASPSLTYASTATSEESTQSAFSSRGQPGAGIHQYGRPTGKDFDQSGTNGISYQQDNEYPTPHIQYPGRAIQFDLRPSPEPRPTIPSSLSVSPKGKKLRKAKPDGYESDGGYVSDSGKSKKDKKKNSKKAIPGTAVEDNTDAGYFTDGGSRKKDKKAKKEKEKERKPKSSDSPTAGYDTDASTRRFRTRKESQTSPLSPEESDGGYISEASGKKRRFFRLNSRKKNSSDNHRQEVVPPVPEMPHMPLPIAERFARSITPASTVDTDTSRTTTPVPGINVIMDQERESIDTFASAPEQLDVEDSLSVVSSFDGLTKAFRDAESVRSPSIDMLSTFMGRARTTRLKPGSPGSRQVFQWDLSNDSISSPPLSPVPVISSPKTSTSRPQISAPNTSMLSPKHTPTPLNLAPDDEHERSSSRLQPSPDPEYVVITPPVEPADNSSEQSTTPTNRTTQSNLLPKRSPSPSRAPPPIITTSSPGQTLVRPHILAYYDLPPPSPPPSGPLPEVPPSPGRSPLRHPDEAFVASQGHFPRNVSMDSGRPSTPPRSRSPIALSPSRPPPTRQLPPPPSLSRTESAPVSGTSQMYSSVPILSQPVPPIQRGRESPFPSAPVVQRDREDVTELLRKNVPVTAGTSAPSVSPAQAARIVQARGNVAGPASASALDGRAREQLGVHWQPRSASVLEMRRQAESRRSWMDPEEEKVVHRPFADVPVSGRSSLVDLEDDRSDYGEVLPGRGTVYYSGDEAEGDEAERYSVWSANTNARASILDGERSEQVRQQFVRRVEAMYGQETIPPVPPLPRSNHANRSGSL